MKTDELVQLAKDSIVKADSLLSELVNKKVIVSSEGKDLKLQADIEIDKLISTNLIEKSLFSVLSEEQGFQLNPKANVNHNYRWIVDPLDGSVNFLRGIDGYAVSVALWKDNDPIFGVVFDYVKKDLYVGIVGENATLNGTTITTSNIKNSCEGILATGFPVKDKLNDSNYKERMTLFSKFKKIRMFGTAVISIVLVASGKVDAYYESSIRIWDVAGPLAILKAAGGEYKIRQLDDNTTYEVFANNGLVNV
jgi:myo-inositol-1(or 4)-monophosphatase